MSNIGYTGSIIAFNGYYIHYHQENIGKADGHSVPDIVSTFQSHRTDVLTQSKETYKKLFKESILKGSSRKLLNEAFSKEDVLTEIDRQMTKQMQELIATDKLQLLMEKQRSLYQGKQGNINFVNLLSSGSKEQIEELDKLISVLIECCKILNSTDGSQLAIELINFRKSNFDLQRLQQALDDFTKENDNELISIDRQRAISAAQSINALARGLIAGKTSKGKELTTQGAQKMVDAIFNTGFGEAVASMIDETANAPINRGLIELTGKKGVSGVQISLNSKNGDKITDAVRRSGKADIKFSNLRFKIQQNGKTQGGRISMTVGLSNKLYKTNHFKNLDKKQSFHAFEYSSGSGGTFKEAIDAIFNSSIYNKYLAYNVMARRSTMTKEAQALQDLILTRQIVKLFSSRGGQEDFSQWMLVNGEIISIWQIILSTEKFVGLSHSQMTQTSEQAVSLSLPGTQDIEKEMIKREAEERVPIVNKKLNEMTIKAYVHIDKLKKAAAKST